MFKKSKNQETINQAEAPKNRKEEIKHGADLVALVATVVSTAISISDVVADIRKK